jgi:general secretion pathway protein C
MFMNTIKIPWFIYPVLIAFSFSWLVTGYISYKYTPVTNEGVVISGGKRSSSPGRDVDLGLINGKNVFGLRTFTAPAGTETAATEQSGAEAVSGPAPRLIKLIGILLGGQDEASLAFLDIDGEKVLFSEGETVFGVRLESVSKTNVVIISSGGRKTIELYETAFNSPSSLDKTSGSSGRQDNEDESEPGDMSPTEKIAMSRSDFVSGMGDVNGIIKSVLMRPYERNGQIIGYRLSRMTKDSVLRSVGLRNGDAIIRINGEELKSPDVLFGMLSSVENISAVTLDIERAGAKKTIFVEIN